MDAYGYRGGEGVVLGQLFGVYDARTRVLDRIAEGDVTQQCRKLGLYRRARAEAKLALISIICRLISPAERADGHLPARRLTLASPGRDRGARPGDRGERLSGRQRALEFYAPQIDGGLGLYGLLTRVTL